MPLHRDIFWIGRQWAVTGFGMQAVNQKHGGEFDIPIARLWDDNLLDAVRGQKWFNPDDFSKGLEIARARHPRPPPKPAPPPLPVAPLLQASGTIAMPQPVAPVVTVAEAPAIAATEAAGEPLNQETPPPSPLRTRLLSHSAKFLRVWRVRRRQ